jgi:hypothetical protein
MTGGICFLADDKMCVSVVKEKMMARDFEFFIRMALEYNPRLNPVKKIKM